MGGMLMMGCTPCNPAQDYRVNSAVAEAHRITERDNLGFFSERMILGDDVRWDSLAIFVLPQVQFLGAAEPSKGAFMQAAYACDPGVSLPTQQVTDIKIYFDQPVVIDNETYAPGVDLSEIFMVFDFYLGEEFAVSQYLDQTDKKFVIQGMFFSMARSLNEEFSGTISIDLLLDGVIEVKTETVPLTIRTSF